MKVDAVITWVDGGDSEFVASKERYKQQELGSNKGVLEIGLLNTRFDNVGEVLYCIQLIRKNLVWVNKIFILTNGQVPKFLTAEFIDEFGVILITHSEVFGKYDKYLPVFNSRSIEAMISEIPDISEEFMYFNDDVFIINKMAYSDFKVENKYVIRGLMRFKNIWLDRLQRIIGFKYVEGTVGKREESNSYPNKLMYFTPAHGPYLINRDLYRKAIESHGGYENIVKYKFRNKKQSWPIGLYINALAKEQYLCKNYNKDWGYFHGETDSGFDLKKFDGLKFISAQSLDCLTPSEIQKVLSYLDNKVSS